MYAEWLCYIVSQPSHTCPMCVISCGTLTKWLHFKLHSQIWRNSQVTDVQSSYKCHLLNMDGTHYTVQYRCLPMFTEIYRTHCIGRGIQVNGLDGCYVVELPVAVDIKGFHCVIIWFQHFGLFRSRKNQETRKLLIFCVTSYIFV